MKTSRRAFLTLPLVAALAPSTPVPLSFAQKVARQQGKILHFATHYGASADRIVKVIAEADRNREEFMRQYCIMPRGRLTTLYGSPRRYG